MIQTSKMSRRSAQKKKKEIKDKSNTETRKEKFRMAFQFLFRFLNTEGRARRAPLVSLWFEET